MRNQKHIVDGKMDMLEAARRTNIKGGRNALYKLLRLKRQFNNDNTPKRPLKDAGFFTVEFTSARQKNGIRREYSKTWVTPDGLTWLHEFVEEHGEKKPDNQNAA